IGCRSIFSERENGAMTLRRGFTVKEGERVLICEDVCTTGGSAKEVGAMLRAKGANVVGYTSIIDRSGGKVQFDAPYRALETLTVETYDPSDCPLCKAGTTAVKPGSHGLK
ncbi:orotate phosphoribosyltransferase, partial [bacterium]|nr:orotate phosphoribosyltransferase [bacterium]